MSRVKSQKSLGESDIVTVSRVKTPGEVSGPLENRNSKIENPFSIRAYPRFEDAPQAFAPIRAYSRLFASIRGLNFLSSPNRSPITSYES
jgi:hypothetical protein